MMQELLGGAGLVTGERKISINGVLETKPHSLSSSSSHTSSSTTSATTTTTNSSNSENLRCPRCDSSNTKFCYYNNYNLTQPRHFCKTCRRYWTKGGALRNVPIGGGCRKNRNPTMSASLAKTGAGKIKMTPPEMGRSGFGGPFDIPDHQLQPNPILWGSPQNSHILALLRSTQNPNPNPSFLSVKEEGLGLIGTHLMNDSSTVNSNGRNLGLDTLNQGPSLGLCSSSYWRTNNQNLHPHPHQQQSGFILGEVQNSGIQELYQRLRSSTTNTNYYNNDNSAAVLTNLATSSSASSVSTVLDSSSVVAGGELAGYWNSAFSSWSDLPTTTGAYP